METSPSSRVFPLGGCRRARDVCDRRSWSQCCHFVRDQILPWAFDLALFYLRRPNLGLHEGTGILLYFLVNRVLTKNEGPCREKITQKSRNSYWSSGGGVDAKGLLTRGPNELSSRTKYKRSNNTFPVLSVALSFVFVCLRLLQLLVHSLIWIPGTLFSTFE